MATMKFRFSTECEISLNGDNYQETYLQFKDFMHGDQGVLQHACVRVFPPESVQVFFNIGGYGELHEIPQFKGDYRHDIGDHCEAAELHLQDIPHRVMASQSAEQWHFW